MNFDKHENEKEKKKSQSSLGSNDFFSPENVQILVAIISASVGLTATTVKAISLWVEERKSRKIRIKHEDIELEISGAMTKEQIEEKIELFSNAKKKFSEKNIKIITEE